MEKFNLSINQDEAVMITTALSFIEKNLCLDLETMAWHFVPGKPYNLSIKSAAALYLLNGYIKEAAAEAAEDHPFAPFIQAF